MEVGVRSEIATHGHHRTRPRRARSRSRGPGRGRRTERRHGDVGRDHPGARGHRSSRSRSRSRGFHRSQRDKFWGESRQFHDTVQGKYAACQNCGRSSCRCARARWQEVQTWRTDFARWEERGGQLGAQPQPCATIDMWTFDQYRDSVTAFARAHRSCLRGRSTKRRLTVPSVRFAEFADLYYFERV